MYKHKKKFGQNFISDTNLLKSIVNDAQIDSTSRVLEIGMGEASLTRELCKVASLVVGYEIDKDLQIDIEKNLQEFNNKSIFFKDFMEVSESEIANQMGGEFSVVANLPYYITTPIIFKLLESNLPINSITVMVQKEVAQRLCATKGTKDYGAVTVKVNAICDVHICRYVSRKMFTPEPNVDSAIIRLVINKKKHNIANMQIFDKVVKSAFNNRRKIFKSNLKSDFKNISDEDFNWFFATINADTMCRGETLTVEQFVNLSKLIAQI